MELGDTLRHGKRLNVLTLEQIRDILVTGRHTPAAVKSKPLAGLLADTREGQKAGTFVCKHSNQPDRLGSAIDGDSP